MKNFTFKTNKPTGAYKSFFSATHNIKLNGLVVGELIDGEEVKIRFRTVKADINEDKNPNCVWKWVTLKKKFASLHEAKAFIKENNNALQEAINLFAI